MVAHVPPLATRFRFTHPYATGPEIRLSVPHSLVEESLLNSAQANSSMGRIMIVSAPRVPPPTRKLRGRSGNLRRICQNEIRVRVEVAMRDQAYTAMSCGTLKTASPAQNTVVRRIDRAGVPKRTLTLASPEWR